MLTKNQIEFLNRTCPQKWTESNGVINVTCGVDISCKNLTRIPVQFGRVDGNFECPGNQLTSLKGSPFIVNGYFTCYSNKLTSLKDGPKEVGGYYSCQQNQLTNLIGAPEICNSEFDCERNQLTSLEGSPRLIKRYFYCRNNPNLEYLWGIGQVNGFTRYDIKNIHTNNINLWINLCSREGLIFPYYTLDENINWIKDTLSSQHVRYIPDEINFSKYLHNLYTYKIC